MTVRLALIVAALVLLAGASSALGQSQPEVLQTRLTEPRTPDAAVNRAGRAVTVWTARAGDGFAVFAAARPARAADWGPVRRVSEVAASRPLRATVALGDDGTAVALWRVAGGAVESATLAPAETAWSRLPVATGGEGFASPAVATGAAGRAVAVWADRAEGRWRAHRAVLAQGAWSLDLPLDLTAAGIVPEPAPDLPPALAVNGRGDAVVAWPRRPIVPGYLGEPGTGPVPDAPPTRVRVALRPAVASGWRPADALSERGAHADVALSPSGHAGVIWVEDRASLTASIREPDAAGWPEPVVLAGGAGGATASYPRLAINSEGYALAGWASSAGTELAVMARMRSGASELWGPARTVFDRFSFFSILDLTTLQAAVDEGRRGHLAWLDPEGPGSASVHAATGDSGGWRQAAEVRVVEDLNEPALAADARGGAVLATPRALGVGPPNVELVVASYPEPPRFAVSAGQLLINQRISQAAVGRVNAALDRLEAGLRAEHIRNGTLEASDFGEGVRVAGEPSGEAVPPQLVPPLEIAPPGPRAPGGVALTAAQLLINQRISQAAVERSNLGRALFDSGLTGAQVADGAVTAGKLLPGLRIEEAVPVDTPLPPSPTRRTGPRAGGAVTLTALQLRINQRISQAAVLRANWLVEKLEGGIRGGDVRGGGLRREDLAPELRTG